MSFISQYKIMEYNQEVGARLGHRNYSIDQNIQIYGSTIFNVNSIKI